jgi:hypothetical protein
VEDFKKVYVPFVNRIRKLESMGLFLEAYFLTASMLEVQLEELLDRYEAVSMRELNRIGFKFDVQQIRSRRGQNDARSLTLTQLRNWLMVYCDDQEIIQKSQKFITLRDDIAHSLIKKDFQKINEKLQSEINPLLFFTRDIMVKNRDIIQKQIDHLNWLRSLPEDKISYLKFD